MPELSRFFGSCELLAERSSDAPSFSDSLLWYIDLALPWVTAGPAAFTGSGVAADPQGNDAGNDSSFAVEG